jgi:hypothetical protein
MSETEPDIRVEDIDRVFSLVERTIEDETLGGPEVERLVSVLEQGLEQLGDDPSDIAEFVTLLEELLVEPDDLTGDEARELLRAVEVALAETTGQEFESGDELLDVLADAVRDPASLESEEVERFQNSLGSTLAEMAGPQGFGQLFTFPGAQRREETNDNDGEIDMFQIARLAAGLTQRATGNSVESGVRAGTRMAYAAAHAESPADLLTQTRALTLEELQQAGIDIGDDQSQWLDQHEDETLDTPRLDREQLQARGQRLLSKSAGLEQEEAVHPAFQSVLDQLAADEARILRLLATEGPQPSISVYDRGYVPFRTRLIASHLTRMGGNAGCRQPERTQVYADNLERLGLIEFLDQPIEEMKRYQVLEAQSHIEAATAEAKWPKTVYGMARLTDFGMEFCDVLFDESPENHQPASRFWEGDR